MARTATRSVNWAVEVASRMKGVDFPMNEDEARSRLEGMSVDGRSIEQYIDNMTFPISTPAELLHQISRQTGATGRSPRDEWSIEVAKSVKDFPFPLSKEKAKVMLEGMEVRGQEVFRLIEHERFPIDSPSRLLRAIAQNLD